MSGGGGTAMTDRIDPKLIHEEAARIEPMLRRLENLRRGPTGQELPEDELAMNALIEAASQPPRQE